MWQIVWSPAKWHLISRAFGRRVVARHVAQNVDIRGIVPLEVFGSNQNSALLAAHRRWVARSG